MLFPTPDEALCDAQGRPYFLWDTELTLDELRARLRDDDPEVRGFWLGKLLRQAKPDDAMRLVTLADIRAHWQWLDGRLGRVNDMWRWLVWDSGWSGG